MTRSRMSALAVACAAFAYGVLVGAWHLFPYEALRMGWTAVTGGEASGAGSSAGGAPLERVVETSLFELTARSYPGIQGEPNPRPGGGLAVLGDVVLGVDRWGQFFVYRGRGDWRPLDIHVPTNVEDLRRRRVTREELAREGLDPEYLATIGLDLEDPSAYNLRSFRFMDVAVEQAEGRAHVYTSYYYWHPEEACKTVRVARSLISDLPAAWDGRPSVDGEDWEVVFESRPCLELSYRNDSPFQSPNSGGRLLPDGERLLLTLGDHHLDGQSSPVAASQRNDTDYGKVIAIDLASRSARHVAKGMRNPQGLARDRYGRVWLTEHGPRGGDELNLLREGANYGWPLVTFGTAYGAFAWKPNPRQGRHEGYAAPVYAWVPSIGASNLLEVGGVPAPWDGDLLVASLEANSLFRLRLDGERVVVSEPMRIGERIRDVAQMADGTLLLWTDSRRLIELTPRLRSVP